MSDAHADPDAHMPTYNRSIILLAVLTAVEFGIAALMHPDAEGEAIIPFVAGVLVMLALAAWKAIIVGQIFMHLKYDPRILRWIAISPVVLGAPLIALACFDAIRGPTF